MRGKGRRKRPHPAQLNSRPYEYGDASEAMSHNIYSWCTVKFQLMHGSRATAQIAPTCHTSIED